MKVVCSPRTESPKTPGGISKSLLTPCRRVGLSRNLKRGGAVPFQSPLSSKSEVKQENLEVRKRKPLDEENFDNSGASEDQNVQTPTRKVEQPRQKKSKTLLSSISKSLNKNKSQEDIAENTIDTSNYKPCEDIPIESSKHMLTNTTALENTCDLNSKQTVTPLRLKSKSRIKRSSYSNEVTVDCAKENEFKNSITEPKNNNKGTKEKSPNNLTKECIVVIQKKIFKRELKHNVNSRNDIMKTKDSSANITENKYEPAFDSDSDNEPLICLNKVTENRQTDTNKPILPHEDNDVFVSSKIKLSKPVKVKSKIKLTSPAAKTKSNSRAVEVEIHKVPDWSDDDDDFKKKRTILIRKSYDKLAKPQKMKSTGSITQKDIDDLSTRIEFKKKLLLAKAASEDTKQIMDLIKKWHKGCQESLIQLMDLMKSKFTDKQNMGYSEILQTLNIPPSLVGYDSENDCFLTPDDESILTSVI